MGLSTEERERVELVEDIARLISEKYHLGIESASVDAEDFVDIIEDMGWGSPSFIRHKGDTIRAAFRMPRLK